MLDWIAGIAAEKGGPAAAAGALAVSDGPYLFGDAIAAALLLTDLVVDRFSQITIENKENEDSKPSPEKIKEFLGEQSTPANPPPNGNNDDDDNNNSQDGEPKEGNGLDYKSNPKHSLGDQGNRNNAGIEPENAYELFQNSIPDPKNPNVRFSYEESTGGVHRFFSDGNGTWHWSGSTIDPNNPLSSFQIPVGIRRMFGLPMKGW